jgi:hypothetical protein
LRRGAFSEGPRRAYIANLADVLHIPRADAVKMPVPTKGTEYRFNYLGRDGYDDRWRVSRPGHKTVDLGLHRTGMTMSPDWAMDDQCEFADRRCRRLKPIPDQIVWKGSPIDHG